MKVVSKNDYRETNFGNLYPGDAFVMCADIHPVEELLIKTVDGCGMCVQNGINVPFSDSDLVYEVDAIIVVNY